MIVFKTEEEKTEFCNARYCECMTYVEQCDPVQNYACRQTPYTCYVSTAHARYPKACGDWAKLVTSPDDIFGLPACGFRYRPGFKINFLPHYFSYVVHNIVY